MWNLMKKKKEKCTTNMNKLIIDGKNVTKPHEIAEELAKNLDNIHE